MQKEKNQIEWGEGERQAKEKESEKENERADDRHQHEQQAEPERNICKYDNSASFEPQLQLALQIGLVPLLGPAVVIAPHHSNPNNETENENENENLNRNLNLHDHSRNPLPFAIGRDRQGRLLLVLRLRFWRLSWSIPSPTPPQSPTATAEPPSAQTAVDNLNLLQLFIRWVVSRILADIPESAKYGIALLSDLADIPDSVNPDEAHIIIIEFIKVSLPNILSLYSLTIDTLFQQMTLPINLTFHSIMASFNVKVVEFTSITSTLSTVVTVETMGATFFHPLLDRYFDSSSFPVEFGGSLAGLDYYAWFEDALAKCFHPSQIEEVQNQKPLVMKYYSSNSNSKDSHENRELAAQQIRVNQARNISLLVHPKNAVNPSSFPVRSSSLQLSSSIRHEQQRQRKIFDSPVILAESVDYFPNNSTSFTSLDWPSTFSSTKAVYTITAQPSTRAMVQMIPLDNDNEGNIDFHTADGRDDSQQQKQQQYDDNYHDQQQNNIKHRDQHNEDIVPIPAKSHDNNITAENTLFGTPPPTRQLSFPPGGININDIASLTTALRKQTIKISNQEQQQQNYHSENTSLIIDPQQQLFLASTTTELVAPQQPPPPPPLPPPLPPAPLPVETNIIDTHMSNQKIKAVRFKNAVQVHRYVVPPRSEWAADVWWTDADEIGVLEDWEEALYNGGSAGTSAGSERLGFSDGSGSIEEEDKDGRLSLGVPRPSLLEAVRRADAAAAAAAAVATAVAEIVADEDSGSSGNENAADEIEAETEIDTEVEEK
ncbi:hypothetical protein HK100_003507 [Physocladia obscura]|uniref:Uncharacterized protein n=1 Tax=Physocladia obscura TaxID=109957 RepID=A0AAD5SVJ6_9FUNG|nr:hypothetical protein HK100_003507 [Physocladia obscura]